VRILTARAYYYGQGRFSHITVGVTNPNESNGLIQTPSETLVTTRFERFRNYSHFAPWHSPFIVIDDDLVLSNQTKYILGKTSIYRDPASVKKFEDEFTEIWDHAKPISEEAYKAWFYVKNEDSGRLRRLKIPTLGGIKVNADERAYLLRFVEGPAADLELQELAKSADPIIQSEAKRSIKLRTENDAEYQLDEFNDQ